VVYCNEINKLHAGGDRRFDIAPLDGRCCTANSGYASRRMSLVSELRSDLGDADARSACRGAI
jgi:hypothetical protein